MSTADDYGLKSGCTKNRSCPIETHEGVSKSFRTGRLELELQMVQLFATTCRCTAVS